MTVKEACFYLPLRDDGHDLLLGLLSLLSASHTGVDNGPEKFSTHHYPHVFAKSGQVVSEPASVVLV